MHIYDQFIFLENIYDQFSSQIDQYFIALLGVDND
jgi:hypothetical protein